ARNRIVLTPPRWCRRSSAGARSRSRSDGLRGTALSGGNEWRAGRGPRSIACGECAEPDPAIRRVAVKRFASSQRVRAPRGQFDGRTEYRINGKLVFGAFERPPCLLSLQQTLPRPEPPSRPAVSAPRPASTTLRS